MPLFVEVIPAPLHGVNVRTSVAPEVWDVLRRACYTAAGHACEVCGGRTGGLHAHEVWAYDDVRHVQSLVRLQALCPSCHETKHIGRAAKVGRLKPAIRHLREINRWTLRQVTEHLHVAGARDRERRRHTWICNMDALAAYGVTPPAPRTGVLKKERKR